MFHARTLLYRCFSLSRTRARSFVGVDSSKSTGIGTRRIVPACTVMDRKHSKKVQVCTKKVQVFAIGSEIAHLDFLKAPIWEYLDESTYGGNTVVIRW